jgi:hypothetical protein
VPPEATELEQYLKNLLDDPKRRREIVEAIVHDKGAFDILYREIERRLQYASSYTDSRFASP